MASNVFQWNETLLRTSRVRAVVHSTSSAHSRDSPRMGASSFRRPWTPPSASARSWFLSPPPSSSPHSAVSRCWQDGGSFGRSKRLSEEAEFKKRRIQLPLLAAARQGPVASAVYHSRWRGLRAQALWRRLGRDDIEPRPVRRPRRGEVEIASRMGGRVVECGSLENCWVRKCPGGSNPSPSACFLSFRSPSVRQGAPSTYSRCSPHRNSLPHPDARFVAA